MITIGRFVRLIWRVNFNYSKYVIALLLFIPSLTLASGFGGLDSDMLTTILEGVISLITSSYARLFMVLSIITVGYLWMWKGVIPAGRAMGAIIGIGMVFSASYICTYVGIPGS